MEQLPAGAQKALDRLERRVEQASRLIADLRRENAALQSRREGFAAGALPAGQAEVSPHRFDEERRLWAGERQALADRLRVILGKFQWLEGEVPRSPGEAEAWSRRRRS